MNLLLSSYSFGAGRGSEAGVGWNVARGLALRGHKVTVITTREFSSSNRDAIEKENLNIRLVEEDCGVTHYPSGSSYRKWQRNVGRIINREAASQHYDLIHHVTFNQYRDILDVFSARLPYLIGPVGGAELIPRPLFTYGDMPLRMRIKESLRYCALDALPLITRSRAHKAAGLILASNRPTAERLARLPMRPIVCPAIAIHEDEILKQPAAAQEKSYILFDGGLARPQKGTWLALRALCRLWQNGYQVPIRMVGIKQEDKKIILDYARKINLPAQALQLEEQVSRATMLQYMQGAAIMLSCVYRDSGSMALLEALAQGSRLVCLDIPSQEWLPPSFCHKVAVESSSETMETALAQAVQHELTQPPHSTEWHAERVLWLKTHMTWEARISTLESYYKQLLS